jgi:AraC-like DNA-binding protein
VFEGESHNFWELVYIDKGELVITAGSEKYVLKQGELAFHYPNEFHAIAASNSSASNIIVASFDCHSRAMQQFKHKIMVLSGDEKEYLYAAVNLSRKAYIDYLEPCNETEAVGGMRLRENAIPGTQQLIKINLEHFLILLYQRKEGMHIQSRAHSFENRYRLKSTENVIKAFLDEHIHEKINLEMIATHCGYSVSQIKKLFREETGDSIINFAIQLKMAEAKRLICEGNRSFTEIAQMLGYDNIFYFSRLFKAKEGMTLTEYSRSIGQLEE